MFSTIFFKKRGVKKKQAGAPQPALRPDRGPHTIYSQLGELVGDARSAG